MEIINWKFKGLDETKWTYAATVYKTNRPSSNIKPTEFVSTSDKIVVMSTSRIIFSLKLAYQIVVNNMWFDVIATNKSKNKKKYYPPKKNNKK